MNGMIANLERYWDWEFGKSATAAILKKLKETNAHDSHSLFVIHLKATLKLIENTYMLAL